MERPKEPVRAATEPGGDDDELIQISRRVFIKASGVIVIATGIAAVTTGCGPNGEPPTATPIPTEMQYPAVEEMPAMTPARGVYQFFTPHEAQTVEAFTARIIPGDASDPGAREAGVTTYIDNRLLFHEGDDEATYRQAPFALAYDGDTSPAGIDPTKFVPVKKSELPRYSYQLSITPQQEYRMGITLLNRYTNGKYGKDFSDLTEQQQDDVVDAMSNDQAMGFDTPTAKTFYQTLRTDTIRGFFADPQYGGNRDLVGWKLVGYPGAQRSYTVQEMQTEGLYRLRPPQSMAQLMPEGHGQPAGNGVINPVTGTGSNPVPPLPPGGNGHH